MDERRTPRASERYLLDILIEGRVSSRKIYVTLRDLSQQGCCIRGKEGFARTGERVTLNIKGIQAPVGEIVWTHGPFAGISFDGNMHPAVIDHLRQADRTPS